METNEFKCLCQAAYQQERTKKVYTKNLYDRQSCDMCDAVIVYVIYMSTANMRLYCVQIYIRWYRCIGLFHSSHGRNCDEQELPLTLSLWGKMKTNPDRWSCHSRVLSWDKESKIVGILAHLPNVPSMK